MLQNPACNSIRLQDQAEKNISSVALDVPDGTSSDSAISSLAPLASTVESFHMRLATDEVIDPTIPYGEGPCLHPTKTGYQDGSEFATIHSTFNRLTSPKIAESIVNHLQLYSQRALETMKDFRPFVLPSLCEAHDCWPVLMWNEGELEALRLFHVDEDGSTFCNFLTHYASGKRTDGNGKDWMSSAIYWSVSDLRVLRSLFVASQHLTWLGHVTPIESNTEWSAYQDQEYYYSSTIGELTLSSVKEGTKAIFSRMLGIRDTITILEGMMSYFEENSQKTCNKPCLASAN